MTSLAKSLNCDGRNGGALALLGGALLLLAVPQQWALMHLAFDRGALLRGEHWRWFTGHVVHLDLTHAVLNVAGLVLVWALYRHLWSAGQWLFITLAGMLAIDAGLWWWQPHLQWYVGASGVLHALLAAGLMAQLRRERAVALVVAILFVAKLVWEARSGALPFAGEAERVVLPAHRYGAVGGVLGAVLLRAAQTLRRKWL